MERIKTIFILLLIVFTGAKMNGQVQPVNPNATKEARELLMFLDRISGSYILSGQHNYPHEISIYSDSVKAITGKDPVVWGSDFSYHERAVANRQNVIDEAIEMYDKGHIITLMYHQVRPMDDEPDGWKESVQNEVTEQQWEDLLTPGTEVHRKWLEKIDTVAWYLGQLKEMHIPVIWRPYHEMNGAWFWWGQKEDFEKLWILMYDRYVNYHHLDNLIWVWNANAPRIRPGDSAMAYENYFPGTAYVDILAADVYHNDYKQSHHDQLLELAKGKPIALGECGQAPTPGILDIEDQWTWFMIWTKWLWTANKREDIIELYNDPRVITLDEVGELWDRMMGI